MQTLYLRAPTEADMLEALEAARLMVDTDEGRTPKQASHTHALDIIGEIPGKVGYHANLRIVGDVPAAIQSITIPAPAKPARVWA